MKKTVILPSRTEVMAKFFAAWQPVRQTEIIPTAQACGRVLAADAVARCDKPVVRASRMDGVGLRASAFADGIPDASGWRLGVDYCRADTGDDFPDEFDAVVVIEDVAMLPDGGLVFDPDMDGPIVSGWNVVTQGSFIRRGAVIGKRGAKLAADTLAALCIGAIDTVEVYKKPLAAFIPTGSELVPLGTVPQRGQSVDSNSVMAANMLAEMGADVAPYPVVRDNRDELSAALDRALAECDVVVINAGTSKGGEDYCHELLEKGTLIAHGVAAYPGKPIALAILGGKPVINVAGPPAACFNGLDWCVRPIIGAYIEAPALVRRTVRATLSERVDADKTGVMEAIVRIKLTETPEGYSAFPIAHTNRHATDALLADGMYVTKIPPEPTEKGDEITVEILR